MRLIDADALTEVLETMAKDEWNQQVGSSKGLEDAIDVIDNAPTVKSTVWVTIRDQFGNEIIGYEDQTRNLIFTGYGIITTELAQQKKYTIIENKEWRGAES